MTGSFTYQRVGKLRYPGNVIGNDIGEYSTRSKTGHWNIARGIVKFFKLQKGYGFIAPEGKSPQPHPTSFVNIFAVRRSGLKTPSEGRVVEHDLIEDRRSKGISAQNLKIVAAQKR